VKLLSKPVLQLIRCH